MSGHSLDAWHEHVAEAADGVIRSVLDHLPEGGTFFDIGANTGCVTEAAIRERHARVWAWEPVEELALYCQSRNPTAHVYREGLGAHLDRLTIWCDKTLNLGWNTFVTEQRTPGMEPAEVVVMTLDCHWDLPPVDVIKIDVEGYEWAVLRGAHRRILADKPVLIVEFGWGVHHPHRAEEVAELEWLFANGYQRVPYEQETGTTDYVLVPG